MDCLSPAVPEAKNASFVAMTIHPAGHEALHYEPRGAQASDVDRVGNSGMTRRPCSSKAAWARAGREQANIEVLRSRLPSIGTPDAPALGDREIADHLATE